MSFPWSIDINREGSKVVFDPAALDASVNDEISWSNNDDKAHWPGLTETATGPVTDAQFFMEHEIVADDSSDAFRPGATGTLFYACSLHQTERGQINVDAGP